MAPESGFSLAFSSSSSEWVPFSDRLPFPRGQMASAAADRTSCQSQSMGEATRPLFPRPWRQAPSPQWLWPQWLWSPSQPLKPRESYTELAAGHFWSWGWPAPLKPHGLEMQGGWFLKGTSGLPGRKQMAAGRRTTGESQHPPNRRSKGFNFLG